MNLKEITKLTTNRLAVFDALLIILLAVTFIMTQMVALIWVGLMLIVAVNSIIIYVNPNIFIHKPVQRVEGELYYKRNKRVLTLIFYWGGAVAGLLLVINGLVPAVTLVFVIVLLILGFNHLRKILNNSSRE